MYRTSSWNDLKQLLEQAQNSSRLRKNLNLHNESDPVQRFFNALIPGTYVRPHRHNNPLKTETMIVVSGKMTAVLFDENGSVQKKIELSPQSEAIAIDFDPGVWHCVYAIEPCVFFECKQGPYTPITDKDFAIWAPEENSKDAKTFLEQLISKNE